MPLFTALRASRRRCVGGWGVGYGAAIDGKGECANPVYRGASRQPQALLAGGGQGPRDHLRTGSRTRRMVLHYMLHMWDTDSRDVHAAMDEANNFQGGNEMGMMAQGLWNEGMQQGLQRGMQRGMQQGMQQGMQRGMQQGLRKGKAEGLQEALNIKFGRIPRALRRRIARAPLEELEAWFQKAHTAPSLEAIFGKQG